MFQTLARQEKWAHRTQAHGRLQAVLPGKSSGQIGRILKRLRLHGLVKKVGKTYKYYLTELGRRAVLVGLKLKEHLIVPGLATASA